MMKPSSFGSLIVEGGNDTTPVKRRTAHKEVEQRRKQRITHSVQELSCLLQPSCQCGKETHAEVLERVVEKIQLLQKANQQLQIICTSLSSAQEEVLQRKLAMLLAEHLTMRTAISMAQFSHHYSDERRHERVSFGITELLLPCPVTTVGSSHSPPMDQAPILQQTSHMDYLARSGCTCELSHDYLPHPSAHVGVVSQPLVNESWEVGPHCPTYPAIQPSHAPMWRPYDPAPSPLGSTHDQHTQSSSFLVGQLLDNIL